LKCFFSLINQCETVSCGSLQNNRKILKPIVWETSEQTLRRMGDIKSETAVDLKKRFLQQTEKSMKE
jgi:hypothetical protein